jgi:hypothetical protein
MRQTYEKTYTAYALADGSLQNLKGKRGTEPIDFKDVTMPPDGAYQIRVKAHAGGGSSDMDNLINYWDDCSRTVRLWLFVFEGRLQSYPGKLGEMAGDRPIVEVSITVLVRYAINGRTGMLGVTITAKREMEVGPCAYHFPDKGPQ